MTPRTKQGESQTSAAASIRQILEKTLQLTAPLRYAGPASMGYLAASLFKPEQLGRRMPQRVK
jgi:hypothetical protein